MDNEREIERARSKEKRERDERDLRKRKTGYSGGTCLLGVNFCSERFRDKKEELEADPERDQRTVFAYQMPLKAAERDVYEFFSKAGRFILHQDKIQSGADVHVYQYRGIMLLCDYLNLEIHSFASRSFGPPEFKVD
ncbi:hypothetical protein HPP92_016146 [Vanilla planifolia]|uniref:Uncharacterized protein n=1 Tax=Vanilla planifolia TaxID=51239 RepID=A0A835QAF2_VANPL|nr:hypothetical protein HPP92_016146 [Vanilla planifolia]